MPIFPHTPRRLTAVLVAALAACAVAGCSTQSPPKHSERLQKASGLVTFQIDTTPGLWSKTSKQTAYAADDQKIDAKVTKLGSGLQRVELSGIGLANYLWQLDYHAHGGAGGSAPWSRYREAEAVRMYDEISHKLDSVEKRPSPDDPPLRIEVDDAFLSAKHK